MEKQETQYTVLNPRGLQPTTDRIPLVPRLTDLHNKTVYVVNLKKYNTEPFVKEISKQFAAYVPSVKTIYAAKESFFSEDDPKLWDEVTKNADAVIFGVGD
jgi:hypothetical protein